MPEPIVDVSPGHHWVPVAYGSVQISVPADWRAWYAPQCFGGGQKPGWVQVGQANTDDSGCYIARQQQAPHVVIESISALGAQPAGEHRRRMVIHGIPVYSAAWKVGERSCQATARCRRSGSPNRFYVPSLGVGIIVDGIGPMTVLRTIAYTPRAVVMTGGPPKSAPASWQTVAFSSGSEHFSVRVPPAWHVLRTDRSFGSCDPDSGWIQDVGPSPAVISTDRVPNELRCLHISAGQQVRRPSVWLRVDEHAAMPPSPPRSTRSCIGFRSTWVCPADGPPGSVLYASVWPRPSRDSFGPAPVEISLGLGGNGVVDRTILDSFASTG